jgi:peptide/nickel transport system substrate-binding protein
LVARTGIRRAFGGSTVPWKTCLAVALIALAALSRPALAGKADDTLNIAFGGEVTTLDNYKESGREGLLLARLVYDSLLYKDAATGAFKPDLAESYSFVDPKTIEFKLRRGVKFHDGSEMTADDVVYTLNLVSSPQYGARYQIAVGWIDHADKIDDATVRLTMKSPYPLALEMLAGNLPIYPKAYYEKVGSAGMGVKPVGTGPYRLVEMTPGTRFVFERFDDYFSGSPKGRAQIAHLVARVLPEANTQYAELLNGQLDWIWRVPPDEARNLARRPNVAVNSVQILRFAYIDINPGAQDGRSPLADVRVRQALNYAIDRPAIVKALVGGASQVIYGACNPIQFGCAGDVATYVYDPQKAKQLLADAGYGDGFALSLLSSNIPREQVEALGAYLGKVGVKVSIDDQQYAPAISAWRKGAAPLFLSNWGSYGIGDAGLSTGQFFGGTGDDLVKDPELVALMTDANNSVDQDKRKADFAKALRIIADRAYWVPLWTYNVNCGQAKDLDFQLGSDEFAEFYKARWN